jgi:putative PIN family toxin of toxin-antitoxin system
MKKMVIEPNIYLTYIRYNRLSRLINAIETYDLLVYTNNELLEEINRNLPKVIREISEPIRSLIISTIVNATIKIETEPSFSLSPDAKDNFLFDIILRADSEALITNEKVLLSFVQSPVPVYDLKWFKENHPVP